MTRPDPEWTPTPAELLPDPADVLALFRDVPPGNITAADLRAFAQAIFSALYWVAAEVEPLQQQAIDTASVVSSLLTDSAKHAQRFAGIADQIDDVGTTAAATGGTVDKIRDDVDEINVQFPPIWARLDALEAT